jgi:hypothetical protein
MITTLVILAGIIVGVLVVEWANKPSKNNPHPLPPGRPLKKIENVFDLIFPKWS